VRVFNFGSVNIDYVYRVPHLVKPGETLPSITLETVLGGKGANQSVALARAGASVTHLGRLGQSDRWAVDALDAFGVDISKIELLDEPSGHAIIQVDDSGENAIVLHGGANQSFNANAVANMLEDATADDWLLLQNECNALSDVFAAALDKKMKIAFNPAPMTDTVADLPLSKCEVLIVNEVETQQLLQSDTSIVESINDKGEVELNKEMTDLLARRFPDVAVSLTLGGRGAALLQGGSQSFVQAPSVEVVDTTGAGDTFVGYLLAELMSGATAESALEVACAAGALAVTVAGATPGIPDRQQVANMRMGI